MKIRITFQQTNSFTHGTPSEFLFLDKDTPLLFHDKDFQIPMSYQLFSIDFSDCRNEGIPLVRIHAENDTGTLLAVFTHFTPQEEWFRYILNPDFWVRGRVEIKFICSSGVSDTPLPTNSIPYLTYTWIEIRGSEAVL